MDNGIPVLLPEGLHAWTSHSMHFIRSVPLDDNIVELEETRMGNAPVIGIGYEEKWVRKWRQRPAVEEKSNLG